MVQADGGSIPSSLFEEIIGEDNLAPGMFQNALRNSARRDAFWRVIGRLGLLRYLDATVVRTEVHHTERVQLQSLRLYLLCTCVDAWSGEKYPQFDQWLESEDGDCDPQRTVTDSLRSSPSLQDARQKVIKLYKLWQEHYSATKVFRHFFQELCNPAARYLTSNWLIWRDAEINDAEAIISGQSMDVLRIWQSKSLSEQLEQIARYLYEFRRNPFTHEAKDSPSWYTPLDDGYHWKAIKRSATKCIAVGYKLPEYRLLRVAVVARVRGDLGFDVTDGYIQWLASYIAQDIDLENRFYWQETNEDPA
jgi:hypothetical protein